MKRPNAFSRRNAHSAPLRLASFALSLLVGFSVAPYAAAEEAKQTPAVFGDLNEDKRINSSDALRALRIASKLETATDAQRAAGDIDGDGAITSRDARRLLRFAARLEPLSKPGDADAPLEEKAAADLNYVTEIVCFYGSVTPALDLLAERDIDTLIYEIKCGGFGIEDERLFCYAGAIADKIDELQPERIVKEILNEENDPTLRRLMLEFCQVRLTEEAQYEPLLPLLDREPPDPLTVIWLLDGLMELPDAGLLERYAEKFARSGDPELAPHALSCLRRRSPEKARVICDEIISGYDGAFTVMIRAAIMQKATLLSDSSTPQERTELIALMDGILHGPGANDREIADAMIFPLISMRSPESVNYLLGHADEPFIEAYRSFIISENIDVLREMAENGTADADALAAIEEYDSL